MTSVELVSLVCSTLTMHCDCVQYQQGAADFNPWVCTFGSHNCMICEANIWTKSCSNGPPSRAGWPWSMTLTQNKLQTLHLWLPALKGNEECMHLWHRIFRHNRSTTLSTLKRVAMSRHCQSSLTSNGVWRLTGTATLTWEQAEADER